MVTRLLATVLFFYCSFYFSPDSTYNQALYSHMKVLESEAGMRYIASQQNLPKKEFVELVHDVVNARVEYRSDILHYGVEEHYASPHLVWVSRADDCDGYSILKASILWYYNVPGVYLAVLGYPASGGKINYHMQVVWKSENDIWVYNEIGDPMPLDEYVSKTKAIYFYFMQPNADFVLKSGKIIKLSRPVRANYLWVNLLENIKKEAI